MDNLFSFIHIVSNHRLSILSNKPYKEGQKYKEIMVSPAALLENYPKKERMIDKIKHDEKKV